MENEGKQIERIDAKKAIRKHQETTNWEFRDEAAFWYGISQKMDERFFNGLVYPDGRKVPPPVIAFDDLRNKNTIAQYHLFPDEYGIIGRITFNTIHYIDKVTNDNKLVKVWERGKYSQGETLLHEYIHLWQQIGRGKDPYRYEKHRKETHNKEWHAKARELGLNTEGPAGIHVSPATPGSPIDILLKEATIFPPREAYSKPADIKQNWADWLIYDKKGVEKPKGRSTLHKWICPDCGLSVRVGINGDPRLVHDTCSKVKGHGVFLIRRDGLSHTIYESTADNEPEKETPGIIDDVNKYLKGELPEDETTIEAIAEKVGMSQKTLYELTRNDRELSEALQRFKRIQEIDPFKTGTKEDQQVSRMLVALILVEAKKRYSKLN